MRNNFYIILILIATVIFSSYFFKNNRDQSINWTFPYFSGAANYQNLFNWQISPSDFQIAKKLDYKSYQNYRHKKTKITITNTVNNYGYVLIVLIARNIFPHSGEINSVILFQILIHTIASIFIILYILKNNLQKFLFIILYASNPLIIHFVTFPFYYFWMFIPSLSLILINKRKDLVMISIPFITFLLLLSTFIRPTTIFLSVFIYIYAFFISIKTSNKLNIFLFGILFLFGVSIISNKGTKSLPFHTMFVGIGSYPNDFGINSNSDAEGFNYYKKITGLQISTDAISGNYKIDSIRQNYNNLLKSKYLEIYKIQPSLLYKNATLNFLQIFSFGYYTRSLCLSYISSIIGLIVLIILMFCKKWVYIAGIIFYSISYIFYFPPIPAYNFGVYLFLIIVIIDLTNNFNYKEKIYFFNKNHK